MIDAGKDKQVDWEAVEREYSAGIKTLKVIGEEFGVSDAGILKRAKKHGWSRDLKARIRKKADALVSMSVVSGSVSGDSGSLTTLTENQIVTVNAEAIASIQISHRRDIGRARKLVSSLLGELEAQTGDTALFGELGVLMAKPNDNGYDKLTDIYNKVLSLPGRTDAMRKLVESLKVLISLERQAYRMDDDAPEGSRLPEDLANMSTEELKKFAVTHSRKLFGVALVVVEDNAT